MSKSRDLANLVSQGSALADGSIQASDITGTLSAANGGTGVATLTANNVILGNGTSAVQTVAPGASGNVLTSNGTTWTSATSSVSNATATTSGVVYGSTGDTTTVPVTLGLRAGNGGNNGGVFIGIDAGRSGVTGNSNIGIGTQTLYSLTSGAQNVAVGSSALLSVVTGQQNTAVGAGGVLQNATNSNNTAVGAASLFTLTTGANNTAVGSGAGRNVDTTSNSTFVGADAGYFATGQRNTIIGASAAATGSANDLTTGQNNTIIGYNATASAATVNNEITLGNASITSFRVPGIGINWSSNTVPYRNLPPVGTQTGSYTLALSDVGKYIQLSTGSSITIPTSTFAEGDAITLYNNTTGNITITCSAPTAYIAGTNTVKTSMTLATRGVATILFYSATACVVSGNVS